MKENWEASLRLVGLSEGGKVDHPKDPGGRTNRGITQRTFDAWRKSHGKASADVWDISEEEANAILRAQYWDTVRGDDLPSGVDYAVFDAAVNSGPAQAAKWLQAALGVPADGVIGAQTIAACGRYDASAVISKVCDARLAFLRRLKTWSTFGRGWAARVASVRANAFIMASGRAPSPDAASPEAPGKANPKDKRIGGDVILSPETMTAAGGALAAISGLTGPLAYAVAAGIVILALALAWQRLR